MGFEHINPEDLGEPRGWTNGMLAPVHGRLLFVAGHDAAEPEGELQTDDFVDQFRTALAKAVRVVEASGGSPEDVGRITVYVTDVQEYRDARRALGPAYREVMGRHYPAMALVEVSRLVDPRAKVELEVTAVIPVSAS